jgi:FdhD protein
MGAVTNRRVVRLRSGAARFERADSIAVEEPLELRLNAEPFTVTMRTPGHDLELALGFLVSEGVVREPDQVLSAMACPDADQGNIVEVRLAPHVALPDSGRFRRVSSACGLCGTSSIDDVRAKAGHSVEDDPLQLSEQILFSLPERLRAQQRGFDRTGGLHAAGLFDPEGTLLCLREDVGRHNAVDKVVGWAFQLGLLPLTQRILQVSGRASFELVQKAWLAGAPLLSAVSAPSSLAVQLAEDAGMTLVGFNRNDSAVVYAGAHRVVSPS